MQLAQAYLTSQQPARVLDCTSLMQGLSTGRAPLAGLLQISSLAFLQQGKLAAASAQLCAWLQQGAQGTEEACAAVRSFLVALHSQAGGGSSKASHSGAGPAASAGAAGGRATGASSVAAVRCSAEERAAAVQQVAAAAADRCRSDPAVALEVVLHLLNEQVGWEGVCVLQDAFHTAPNSGTLALSLLLHNCCLHNDCCMHHSPAAT
jgi:hypothetical protein